MQSERGAGGGGQLGVLGAEPFLSQQSRSCLRRCYQLDLCLN